MRFAILRKFEQSNRARTFADLALLGILGEYWQAGSERQSADDSEHGAAV